MDKINNIKIKLLNQEIHHQDVEVEPDDSTTTSNSTLLSIKSMVSSSEESRIDEDTYSKSVML